jgi:hypothetical protein
MHAFIARLLSRAPPAVSQKRLVFESKDLHLERAATLYHILLAVGTEAPQG